MRPPARAVLTALLLLTPAVTTLAAAPASQHAPGACIQDVDLPGPPGDCRPPVVQGG
jgi:hypothetical protein